MSLARPEALAWLAAVPALALAVAVHLRERRRAAARFGLAPPPARRRWIRAGLLLLAAALAVVALARPLGPPRPVEVPARGTDVVLVVDTSLSMAAPDAPPDRLGLARHLARRLLAGLEGHRVGLVAFAGTGALQCPLTTDGAAVALFLDALDPEAVSVPGSALASGLEAAARAFGPGEAAKAVVVLSDGEDHAGGAEDAAAALRRAGIAVHAVGIGRPEGAPIPLPGGGYKKDGAGRVVTTRLREEPLQAVARATGGRYLRWTAGAPAAAIDPLAAAIAEEGGTVGGTVTRTRRGELFQVPLLLALLSAGIATALPGRGGAP